MASVCGWLLLRHWRCTPECGWRAYRFSRSQFRQHRTKLRSFLLIGVFTIFGMATVWYAISHASGSGHAQHDDGVQEGE